MVVKGRDYGFAARIGADRIRSHPSHLLGFLRRIGLPLLSIRSRHLPNRS